MFCLPVRYWCSQWNNANIAIISGMARWTLGCAGTLAANEKAWPPISATNCCFLSKFPSQSNWDMDKSARPKILALLRHASWHVAERLSSAANKWSLFPRRQISQNVQILSDVVHMWLQLTDQNAQYIGNQRRTCKVVPLKNLMLKQVTRNPQHEPRTWTLCDRGAIFCVWIGHDCSELWKTN